MPHEDKICLPSCQSKVVVYRMYKEEIAIGNGEAEAISWSSSITMWKAIFKNVIIPKV